MIVIETKKLSLQTLEIPMQDSTPTSQVKKVNLFDKYFAILDINSTPPVLLGYFEKILTSFLEKKPIQVSQPNSPIHSIPSPLSLFPSLFSSLPPLNP